MLVKAQIFMKAKTASSREDKARQLPFEDTWDAGGRAGSSDRLNAGGRAKLHARREQERASVAAQSAESVPLLHKIQSWGLLAKRRGATVGFVLLALWIGYYVIAGQNGLHAYQVKREQSETLTRQILALQQQNTQLDQQVHALENDPDAIEHEARERLHYARPGDVIYTLGPSTPSTNGPIAVQPPQNVLPGQAQ